MHACHTHALVHPNFIPDAAIEYVYKFAVKSVPYFVPKLLALSVHDADFHWCTNVFCGLAPPLSRPWRNCNPGQQQESAGTTWRRPRDDPSQSGTDNLCHTQSRSQLLSVSQREMSSVFPGVPTKTPGQNYQDNAPYNRKLWNQFTQAS